MKKVLCFVSEEMADFEITLALQILKNKGKRDVVPVGYELTPVVGQSGLIFLPAHTLEQAMDLAEVEALIIPGGPIRTQRDNLTSLILKIDHERT